jgi:hypothetical protein
MSCVLELNLTKMSDLNRGICVRDVYMPKLMLAYFEEFCESTIGSEETPNIGEFFGIALTNHTEFICCIKCVVS